MIAGLSGDIIIITKSIYIPSDRMSRESSSSSSSSSSSHSSWLLFNDADPGDRCWDKCPESPGSLWPARVLPRSPGSGLCARWARLTGWWCAGVVIGCGGGGDLPRLGCISPSMSVIMNDGLVTTWCWWCDTWWWSSSPGWCTSLSICTGLLLGVVLLFSRSLRTGADSVSLRGLVLLAGWHLTLSVQTLSSALPRWPDSACVLAVWPWWRCECAGCRWSRWWWWWWWWCDVGGDSCGDLHLMTSSPTSPPRSSSDEMSSAGISHPTSGTRLSDCSLISSVLPITGTLSITSPQPSADTLNCLSHSPSRSTYNWPSVKCPNVIFWDENMSVWL